MSRREKEAEGPNLHKPEDPVHLEGETTKHKGRRKEHHYAGLVEHVTL
jgi:hypothetical protein